MKQGTLKTLGVTALGAAFAASGAGAASAADIGETVETAGSQVVSAPPVQDALGGGSSIGTMPTTASDVVSPDMPAEVAAAEGGDSRAPRMLGGLPIVGQLAGNGLPTETVTDALGGGLPTDSLGAGLPTDALGGGLPLGGLPIG